MNLETQFLSLKRYVDVTYPPGYDIQMGKRLHHNHLVDQDLIKRLRRASGHLGSVVEMAEDGRSCTDLLQQLTAVVSALNGARGVLMGNHLNNCLKPVLPEKHFGLVEELELVLKQAMKG